MIRVTIELLPDGDESRARPILADGIVAWGAIIGAALGLVLVMEVIL